MNGGHEVEKPHMNTWGSACPISPRFSSLDEYDDKDDGDDEEDDGDDEEDDGEDDGEDDEEKE